MKIYEALAIAPDDGSEVEGKRRWCLPNNECTKCQLTTGAQRNYPAVDLTPLKDLRPFSKGSWPVSLEQFSLLFAQVRPLVPAHLPLHRSTGLGPFKGVAHDTLSDYAITAPGVGMLFKAEAFQKLREGGLPQLIGVPVEVRSRKEPNLKLMEIQVDGVLSLASEVLPKEGLITCPLCGRNNLKILPKCGVVVKKTSIPADGDIFLLLEYGSPPLVTQRFKDAVEKLKLTNIEFVEIKVADE